MVSSEPAGTRVVSHCSRRLRPRFTCTTTRPVTTSTSASESGSSMVPSAWFRSRQTTSDHRWSDSNSSSWRGPSSSKRTRSRRSLTSPAAQPIERTKVPPRAIRIGRLRADRPRHVKEPIVPTFAFSTDRAAELAVDVLVLPVFEGPEAGPGVRDVKGLDLLGQFSATGAKGKLGESLLVPTTGEAVAAKAVLLVGVGPKDAASPDTCRRAIGRVARQLARRKTVATTLPQIVRAKDQLEAVQATVEGVLLGSYRFDRYKSK